MTNRHIQDTTCTALASAAGVDDLLADAEQLVEGVLGHGGLDALDPLLHVLARLGLDLVRRVASCMSAARNGAVSGTSGPMQQHRQVALKYTHTHTHTHIYIGRQKHA